MVTAHHRNGHHETAAERPEEGLPPPNAEAFAELTRQLRELWTYACHYAAVRNDGLRVRARRLMLQAILWGLVAIVGMVGIITATILAVVGMAEGIGSALGGNPWAGKLLLGGGILLIAAVGLVLATRRILKLGLKSVMTKYEHRHNQQRAAFGRDIVDRAVEPRFPR